MCAADQQRHFNRGLSSLRDEWSHRGMLEATSGPENESRAPSTRSSCPSVAGGVPIQVGISDDQGTSAYCTRSNLPFVIDRCVTGEEPREMSSSAVNVPVT
ncbi:MAG: hypothetical protein JWM74_451 [Myxococcaceae bacterium]|nr:hypothetical protein [Myxococcaceae bacterium]